MLNQVVLEMNSQLNEAKKQVAASIADEKRLAKQLGEQEQAKASEWEQRAMMALQVTGTRNWRRRPSPASASTSSSRRPTRTSGRSRRRRWSSSRRRSGCSTTRSKRRNGRRTSSLRGRSGPRAQRAIQETMSGLKDASAFETFDRMAEKIDQIEAEAEAGARKIAEEYTQGDVLSVALPAARKGAGRGRRPHGAETEDGDAPARGRAEGRRPGAGAGRGRSSEGTAAASSQAEREELAAALEEMEAGASAARAGAAEESGSVTVPCCQDLSGARATGGERAAAAAALEAGSLTSQREGERPCRPIEQVLARCGGDPSRGLTSAAAAKAAHRARAKRAPETGMKPRAHSEADRGAVREPDRAHAPRGRRDRAGERSVALGGADPRSVRRCDRDLLDRLSERDPRLLPGTARGAGARRAREDAERAGARAARRARRCRSTTRRRRSWGISSSSRRATRSRPTRGSFRRSTWGWKSPGRSPASLDAGREGRPRGPRSRRAARRPRDDVLFLLGTSIVPRQGARDRGRHRCPDRGSAS